MKLIEAQCPRGCKFLKEANDPTLCKCAAEIMGKRPASSDGERKLDDLLNVPADMIEAAVLRTAISNLNARSA